MKAFILSLLFAAGFVNCPGQDEIEQTEPIIHNGANVYISKIIKDYFRSDPYQHGFGWFLQRLMNDPILVNKIVNKRTDTSFFFFQGDYKNYSPFSFLANRTEIILAEKEFVVNDSLSLKDTLFVYQLLGYNANGESGLKAVKSEFSKFNRHFGKHFLTQSSEVKNGTEVTAVVQDYFIQGIEGSPLTIAWIKLDESQNAFSIAIRLKVNHD